MTYDPHDTGPNDSDADKEVNLQSVDSEESNGVYHAGPGEVQTKLNTASNDGGGTVKLNPQESYSLSSTWTIDAFVTLNGRGATVSVSADTDALALREAAAAKNLTIDTESVTLSNTSSVVSHDVDAEPDDNTFRYNYRTRAININHNGTMGEGRVIYLHQSDASANEITFAEFDVNSDGSDTYLDIHSEGAGGWINSCKIAGVGRGFDTFWKTRGAGDIRANLVTATAQPVDRAELTTTIGWDHQTGQANTFRGKFWDPSRMSSGDAWRIGSGAGGQNKFVNELGRLKDDFVTDNLGDSTNGLIDYERWGNQHAQYDLDTGARLETEVDGDSANYSFVNSSGTFSTVMHLEVDQLRLLQNLNANSNNLNNARELTGPNGNSILFTRTGSNNQMALQTGGDSIVVLDSTNSVQHAAFPDAATLPTMELGTNGARIFVEGGEVKVEDEAGNVTTIS